MAKKHGVGFPINSWRISWSRHAQSPGWVGGPCPPASFLNPAKDPWRAAGDDDHRTPATAFNNNVWDEYLGLADGKFCWIGAADAVDPHGNLARGLLLRAFEAGKLGSPGEWDGVPNEQEVHLMTVSAAAYNHLRGLVPSVPAPPPTPDPPVPPPPPNPDPDPPVPPPAPDPPLLTRVRALEDRAQMLEFTAESHRSMIEAVQGLAGEMRRDHEGFVEIAKRRVEALEDTATRLESRSREANRRLDDLTIRLINLETGHGPSPPPTPPSPPQPPGPEPGEKLLGRLSLPGVFYRATAEEPSRAYVVAIEGAPRTVGRVEISFDVELAGDLDDGRRREIYSCTFNGRGQDGIPAYLFVDGRRASGVFRAGDAWNPARGPFSKKGIGLRSTSLSVAQECDWKAGYNQLTLSGGVDVDGFVPSLTTPKRSLVVNFGIPARYADANPQEATSVGFVWSNLVVEAWS